MTSQNNPQPHFRMKLNNHLQSNGGAQRLSWGRPIKGGPENHPSWTIDAFLDGDELGHGTGSSLDAAKEEAARQVLRRLLLIGG